MQVFVAIRYLNMIRLVLWGHAFDRISDAAAYEPQAIIAVC